MRRCPSWTSTPDTAPPWGALPAQPGELPLARRLRSLLSWPANDADPVTQLVRTHRGIHSSADASVLRRAYTIAENMHRGQIRKSGEPYITHPLAVAQISPSSGWTPPPWSRRCCTTRWRTPATPCQALARTSGARWRTWSTG